MININKQAVKISVIFLLVSFLWILFSDKILLSLNDNLETLTKMQTYKGLFFMLVTSVIIYFLVRKEIQKASRYQKILENERIKYKTLFDNANDAIFILNNQNSFTDCNLKTLELFNCTKEQMIGKTPIDVSPGYQMNKMSSYQLGMEKMGLAKSGIPQKFEWIHSQLNSNKKFYTEVSLNKIEISNDVSLLAVVRDISERKKIQKALEESEEKYKTQYNYFPVPILTIKKIENELIFVDINNATKEYPYIHEKAIIGKRVNDFFIRDEEMVLKNTLNKIIETKQREILDVKYEFKSTGRIRILSAVAGFVPPDTILLSIIDITDKKQAQQKIYHAMVNAEEREKSRIAKDLHDDVSPLLSAIKLYIQALLNSNDIKTKNELFEKINLTINEAIQSTSNISNKLSPHILQNFGLSIALNSFIEKVSETTKLHFTFFSDIDKKLDENIEVNLYRVAVELINNTIKYANAKNVSIMIKENKELLEMHFEHNGRGFNLEKVQRESKGMGLRNLFNRISSLNGSTYIDTSIHKGVKVDITVPLNYL